MIFFDCNIIYGAGGPERIYPPVPDVEDLLRNMDAAGVSKALVRSNEQIFSAVPAANARVAQDVRNTDSLYGVWAILPEQTHEIPGPDEILPRMRENRIAAWFFRPDQHNFIFHVRTLRHWFDLAQANRIPILVEFSAQLETRYLLDVLEVYPELTVIISSSTIWPCDRIFRPYLHEFPNTYLELSDYITDGGVEDLVAECGSERILFGSRFNERHFGGVMLMLKHAMIPEADKAQIASLNMERLIGGVRYDQ